MFNSPVIKDPWEHIIVDNFLDPGLFNLIREFAVDKINSNSYGGFFITDDFEDKQLLAKYQIYSNLILENKDKILNLFSRKRICAPDAKIGIESFIAVAPPDYLYPSHCDRADKFLTLVNYIYPEDSTGTTLYQTKDGDPYSTVKWLPGRTLIFAPVKPVTWHSWYSGDKNRVALNTFLTCEQLTEP